MSGDIKIELTGGLPSQSWKKVFINDLNPLAGRRRRAPVPAGESEPGQLPLVDRLIRIPFSFHHAFPRDLSGCARMIASKSDNKKVISVLQE
jgi:hypothetical protein